MFKGYTCLYTQESHLEMSRGHIDYQGSNLGQKMEMQASYPPFYLSRLSNTDFWYWEMGCQCNKIIEIESGKLYGAKLFVLHIINGDSTYALSSDHSWHGSGEHMWYQGLDTGWLHIKHMPCNFSFFNSWKNISILFKESRFTPLTILY